MSTGAVWYLNIHFWQYDKVHKEWAKTDLLPLLIINAVIFNGTNTTVVNSRAIPNLRDDYLLVNTVAVALTPTDCKAMSQRRAAKA